MLKFSHPAASGSFAMAMWPPINYKIALPILKITLENAGVEPPPPPPPPPFR